jgi:hypothetical protein
MRLRWIGFCKIRFCYSLLIALTFQVRTSYPEDIALSYDGTKMFVDGGVSGDDVYEYTLSTGFDVTTASYASKIVLVLLLKNNGPRG